MMLFLIGDNLETDILLGTKRDMSKLIFVQTGVHTKEDVRTTQHSPEICNCSGSVGLYRTLIF